MRSLLWDNYLDNNYETPTIQEDDGYIIIDGVSLPVNREQMRASWLWR